MFVCVCGGGARGGVRWGGGLFWSIENSGGVLDGLKSRGFRAAGLSAYDFSALCATLPHNMVWEELINLNE